jgi:hypothetical protein
MSPAESAVLSGLPVTRILARYAGAAGNEIDSGKFTSPESSACLAANTFGFFLDDRAAMLPPLPRAEIWWPAKRVELEEQARFPWAGGRHPSLDAVVETSTALIGVESKRYEPFRSKARGSLSEAYWREVWGPSMRRFEAARDSLRDGEGGFAHLDAVQLVKHAFGLRTAGARLGKQAVLYYLYAEPEKWPDGRAVDLGAVQRHRDEVVQFAALVAGDEVTFVACTYSELLRAWVQDADRAVASHTLAVAARFGF